MTTDPLADIRAREAQDAVDGFNRDHPVGTPVAYWPGARYVTFPGRRGRGRVTALPGRPSRTRTPAWLVCGRPCVSVEGYPGGIALTHVEVRENADG